MPKKRFSTVVLICILVYGIFKIWVLNLFTPFVESSLQFVGLDTSFLIYQLHLITGGVHEGDYLLGWLFYYPSYFMLHVLFIWILYKNNKSTRNILILLLITVISVLILGVIIFRYVDMVMMANVFLTLFRSLFGLPFILLAIEGGRILYGDIVKLSESKNDTDSQT